MKSFKVKEGAQFTDMSPERFGAQYPAPHRGEVGTQIDFFDGMPVLRFADGTEAQYPLSSLRERQCMRELVCITPLGIEVLDDDQHSTVKELRDRAAKLQADPGRGVRTEYIVRCTLCGAPGVAYDCYDGHSQVLRIVEMQKI